MKSTTILKTIIGLFFIISALSKSLDISLLVSKIQEYVNLLQLDIYDVDVNYIYIELLAASLIFLELVIGIFFLFNIFPKITYTSSLALIVGFTILTFFTIREDMITDCGCMGGIVSIPPKITLAKNIILLLLLILIGSKLTSFCNLATQQIRKSTAIIVISAIFSYSLLFTQPIIDLNHTFNSSKNEKLNTSIINSLLSSISKQYETTIYNLTIIKEPESLSFANQDNINALFQTQGKIPNIILIPFNPRLIYMKDTLDLCFENADISELNSLITSNIGIIFVKNNSITNKQQISATHLALIDTNNKHIRNLFITLMYFTGSIILLITIYKVYQNSVYAEKRIKE